MATARRAQKNRTSNTSNKGLFHTYQQCEISLKRFLQRFFSNSDDVNEMAQETFLRAFGAEVEREIEIKSPKAYLFSVARHLALRELDRKSRQLTDYMEECLESGEPGHSSSLEEEIIAWQKLQLYCRAIADLPEQCRRVFLLRKVYAYTHKEIAMQLGISIRTVEKHIAKGVDRFTDYLRETGPVLNKTDMEDSNPTRSSRD